jgi:hypothetical protein
MGFCGLFADVLDTHFQVTNVREGLPGTNVAFLGILFSCPGVPEAWALGTRLGIAIWVDITILEVPLTRRWPGHVVPDL